MFLNKIGYINKQNIESGTIKSYFIPKKINYPDIFIKNQNCMSQKYQ